MHPEPKTFGEGVHERGHTGTQALEDRALVAGSIWLYLGFIAAAAFGAGLTLTLDNETNGVLTSAVIVAGGVLAPACWLRARTIFERAARESSAATAAPVAPAAGVAPLRRHVRECVEHAWTDVVGRSRPLQHR
jgi:hypothetical protein